MTIGSSRLALGWFSGAVISSDAWRIISDYNFNMWKVQQKFFTKARRHYDTVSQGFYLLASTVGRDQCMMQESLRESGVLGNPSINLSDNVAAG